MTTEAWSWIRIVLMIIAFHCIFVAIYKILGIKISISNGVSFHETPVSKNLKKEFENTYKDNDAIKFIFKSTLLSYVILWGWTLYVIFIALSSKEL